MFLLDQLPCCIISSILSPRASALDDAADLVECAKLIPARFNTSFSHLAIVDFVTILCGLMWLSSSWLGLCVPSASMERHEVERVR